MSVKIEEARLRRMARRQGLILSKSRRRDPNALDYGLYALLDQSTGGTVHEYFAERYMYALDLDDVRVWLKEEDDPPEKQGP